MAGKRHINRIRAALTAFDDAGDALEALDAARRARTSAEALERDLVKTARTEGHSWADIGSLYDMTKQGAQQRFRAATSTDPVLPKRPTRGRRSTARTP